MHPELPKGPEFPTVQIMTPEQAAALPSAAQEIGVVDGQFNVEIAGQDGSVTTETGWTVQDALNAKQEDGSLKAIVIIEKEVPNATGDGTITERRQVDYDTFYGWQQPKAEAGESKEVSLSSIQSEAIAKYSKELTKEVESNVLDTLNRTVNALGNSISDYETGAGHKINTLNSTYYEATGTLANLKSSIKSGDQESAQSYVRILSSHIEAYGEVKRKLEYGETTKSEDQVNVVNTLSNTVSGTASAVHQLEAGAHGISEKPEYAASIATEADVAARGSGSSEDHEADCQKSTQMSREELEDTRTILEAATNQIQSFLSQESTMATAINRLPSSRNMEDKLSGVMSAVFNGNLNADVTTPALHEIETALYDISLFVSNAHKAVESDVNTDASMRRLVIAAAEQIADKLAA